MSYLPQVPFRRAYDAVRLADFQAKEVPANISPVSKWDVLRELGVARREFGLSDRTLNVLQALLSFHSETELTINGTPPIVYPANATICARLNGMPCSTMRRHLAALVNAGFLIRRDSPNGKRFKRSSGAVFGFDLSPLVTRFAEIHSKADHIRQTQAHIDQLRLDASLMRRDLTALSELARVERPDLDIWDAFDDLAQLFARELRRKLGAQELELVTRKIQVALADLQEKIETLCFVKMSTNSAQNEQHHQNSNKEIEDKNESPKQSDVSVEKPCRDEAQVSLGMVTSTCLEIKKFFADPVQDWPSLVRIADELRPMMGVSLPVWKEAMRSMGVKQAAVVLVAMLERFDMIRSPNGYLRTLCKKAETGRFTCVPMLAALTRERVA